MSGKVANFEIGGTRLRGMRGARKTPEQELEETRAELASAEEKQARWAARVAELRVLNFIIIPINTCI